MFVLTEWQYGVGGQFPLARCRACGGGYLTERPTLSAMAEYYPQNYYAYKPPALHTLFARKDIVSRLWYSVKRGLLSAEYEYRHLGGNQALAWLLARKGPLRRSATFGLDVLLPRFVPDGAILEVGCGSGMYLDLMRALGWTRVLGVDTSRAAIQLVRASLGIEAYCGSLESIGLPLASFDFIAASHTLEHLHDPIAFLSEVHRLLKPGGTLALVLPNLESQGFRTWGAAWYHLDAPRHLTHFTRSSLRLALERAGFEVHRLTTSARAASWTALFSASLARGERRAFWRPEYRAPWGRRLEAACFSLREHAVVWGGAPVGEEAHVLALKAS